MNILITGGGSIGKRHIGNLQQLGYHYIWVLKRQEDEKFEDEHQVKIITDFQQAIDLELDAIIVCTPTALHNESLRFAAQNDLAIFMEKPLIHNLSGLKETKTILENFDKVFFIGFMLRYHSLVQEVHKIIESNELGAVYNARLSFGSFLPYWHPWEDYKTSYASRKELGGGVINTITHELDLIQYFFGAPQHVYCESSNFDLLNIAVEEQCEAIFTYPNKVVTLHLDYLQKDYDRNIKILCEHGKIIWNWHENHVLVHKHKEEPRIIKAKTDFEVNQLYLDELKHFFQLIPKNTLTHGLDAKHAIANTELMLLMHQSATEGKKIKYTHETS